MSLKLEQLKFEQRYTKLDSEFFSRHNISPLENPHLIHFNQNAAKLVGIAADQGEREEFVNFATGVFEWPGSEQFAMCYAGHQFGQYVPRLGDGRAIFLGQLTGPDGRYWDLQVKGAGKTLYSRHGDGRAVLRSSIREYLCSAAMQGLGIPTSHALALFGSDTPVQRERLESGAMIIRVAPSHIRFGSFEYFYYQGKFDKLSALADFTIDHYFPKCRDSDNAYIALLEHIIDKTAYMIAKWQSVGFCHGVMNTDNMSVHGITFDYGPFGFLDTFDYTHICNHSDHEGRYAFNKQPNVALFNLTCLAQALLPLIDADADKAVEIGTECLNQYEPRFREYYLKLKRDKLGLMDRHEQDSALYDELLTLMQNSQVDFTITFRRLCDLTQHQHALVDSFKNDNEAFRQWLVRYQNRLAMENNRDAEKRKAHMQMTNPNIILRNYLAQQAIDKAQAGDYSEIANLMQALKNPYKENVQFEEYTQPPPKWANAIAVSCSS